jgi:glutaredoxin
MDSDSPYDVLMDTMDANQDGFVTFEELADWAGELHKLNFEAWVTQYGEDYGWDQDEHILTDMISAPYDKDEDQVLDATEFTEVYKMLGGDPTNV